MPADTLPRSRRKDSAGPDFIDSRRGPCCVVCHLGDVGMRVCGALFGRPAQLSWWNEAFGGAAETEPSDVPVTDS